GLGKLPHGVAALDVARSYERLDPHRCRAQRAEPEAPDRRVVADDPRLGRCIVAAGFEHGRHVDVIRLGLVGEAAPTAVDADIAGLAAFEEMRERDERAVRLRY